MVDWDYMKEMRLKLWLALGAALVLRLVYFFWSQDLPFFDHPVTDALYHHRLAEAIANGLWWDGQPFFRAPLYPYTLGLIYSLFGSSIWIGKVFGHLIGIATGGLIICLAHRTFGKRVAVIASVLWLGSGLLLFFEGELLLDSFFTFLSLASVYLLLTSEERGYRLALAGLLLGLAAITRPTMLVCIPAYAGWLYVQRGRFSWTGYAMFGLMAALPILVVAGINSAALGRPAGIAMQGGINFYIGNNPQATGYSANLPEPWGYAWNYRQLSTHAESMRNQRLDAVKVSDYYYGLGTDYLTDHPVDAAKLYAKKAVLSLNRVTISNNLNLTYVTNRIPILKWLPVRVWWLFPLALVGLMMKRSDADKRMLWLFATLYATTLILFFVAERFRLPIVPILIVLAASGLSTLWELRRSHLAAALAVLAGGVLLTAPNWYDLRLENEGMAYFNLGNVALRTGQNEKAVVWYDSALAASPEMKQLRLNRGLAHMRLGSLDEAQADYLSEASLFTLDARAHNNLAALHLLRGDTASAQAAIDSGLARDSTLGLLYRQRLSIAESQADTIALSDVLDQALRLAGSWPVWTYWQGELERMRMNSESARRAYERFRSMARAWPTLDGEDLLYAGPDASRTAYSVGLTYLEEGRVDSAAVHFGEAATRDSSFAEAWSNWGTAALSIGSVLTAQSRYRQAIRANPTSPVYWTNLAWAHIQASQLDSARTALVQALAFDPGFGPAVSLSLQLESPAR